MSPNNPLPNLSTSISIRVIMMLSLLMSLETATLFSQSAELFHDTTLTNAQLSSGQLALKETYLVYPYVESLQFVKIGNLSEIQQNGFLDLKIPGDTITYSFSAQQVNVTSNGDYTWIGTLISPVPCVEDSTDYEENDCITGSIMLMKVDTSIFGELHIEDDAFQIKDLGGELNAWIKLQRDTLPVCLAADRGDSPDSTEADLESICPVRVLALYTAGALATHPDILSIIQMSIANMNFILQQSHISEQLLTLVLAGTQLLDTTEFQEAGGTQLFTDAQSLAGNTAVVGYKESYNADLVAVFSNDVYTAGGVVAAQGDNASKCDSAYAIVEAGYATYPALTFSHEGGHLFGARHEQKDLCFTYGDDSGLPYSHAWIATKKFLGAVQKQFKTTVGACAGTTTIEYYSNPNIKYKTKTLGGSYNYNAKTIAKAACRVSHCVNSEEPYVTLIAPTWVCPGEEQEVFGVVSGVPGPILYYWQTSDDGFTYTPDPPSASSYNDFVITAPSTSGQKIWVKLTAGSSGGPLVSVNKMITANDQDLDCGHQQPPLQSGEKNKLTPIDVSLSPNPAYDEIRINLNDIENTPFEIVIFDALGKVVEKITGYTNGQGIEVISIPISNLTNGIYSLNFRSKNITRTVQFICLR